MTNKDKMRNAAPDLYVALVAMADAIRECAPYRRGDLYMADVLELADEAIAKADANPVTNEAEKECPKTFKSDDGSTRCTACHLHPDTCTCNPAHPLWEALGFPQPPAKQSQ